MSSSEIIFATILVIGAGLMYWVYLWDKRNTGKKE